MKISRPLSSILPSEQSRPSPIHCASGQSILGGGRGNSTHAQGYKDPPDHFQGGTSQGGLGGGVMKPCASGSSVRGGGGGHSGNVGCSFVPPEGGASGESKTKPSPMEKLAQKLGDFFKKLFATLEPAHSPGRVATGDSSRSSGSTHSGSGQGRIGVDEEPQA